MRVAFFLLLLANVAFFGYQALIDGADDPAERIARLEVNPAAIKVLPLPGRAPVQGDAAGAAAACLEFGSFSGAEVARADAALAALGLPGLAVQRVAADVAGYWVYVPPMKTKSEAEQRAAALRARGDQDVHVIQDGSARNNAISLGVYKSEEAARARADQFKGGAVGEVMLERREQMLRQVSFFVREPDPATIGRLAALQRDFAGSEVKAVRCPSLERQPG